MSDLDDYRIHRLDRKNIVIQQKTKNGWVTRSYHGNNAFSLISGVFDLATSQVSPTGENLSHRLETVRLEIVSSLDEIEKMIRERMRV